MRSIEAVLHRLKSLAAEHRSPLVGVAVRALPPILVGDASKLAYPSLVRRLFDSLDDTDRLRAQIARLGSPRMYSQGTTTGIFGLIDDGIVYGIFLDTSDSVIAQYRLATSMHVALTAVWANEDSHDLP